MFRRNATRKIRRMICAPARLVRPTYSATRNPNGSCGLDSDYSMAQILVHPQGLGRDSPRLFDGGDQFLIREASRGAGVLALPVADRTPRLETRQAIGAADVIALLFQRPLQRGDVGAQEAADLAPFAGKILVAMGDAVGAMADEERVEVALVVFLEHIKIRRDDKGRAVAVGRHQQI